MMDILETLSTAQFTFVSSVSPDSSPTLMITGPNSFTTVTSITSTSSDSTHYYAFYTTTSLEGVYVGRWVAQKTVSSSVMNFSKSFLFNVKQTRSSF